uniref:Uncharacterized protein n=1 Tax=Anopheles atroparvus TaxID=41427 RepID=A0A182JJW6_ANOAO
MLLLLLLLEQQFPPLALAQALVLLLVLLLLVAVALCTCCCGGTRAVVRPQVAADPDAALGPLPLPTAEEGPTETALPLALPMAAALLAAAAVTPTVPAAEPETVGSGPVVVALLEEPAAADAAAVEEVVELDPCTIATLVVLWLVGSTAAVRLPTAIGRMLASGVSLTRRGVTVADCWLLGPAIGFTPDSARAGFGRLLKSKLAVELVQSDHHLLIFSTQPRNRILTFPVRIGAVFLEARHAPLVLTLQEIVFLTHLIQLLLQLSLHRAELPHSRTARGCRSSFSLTTSGPSGSPCSTVGCDSRTAAGACLLVHLLFQFEVRPLTPPSRFDTQCRIFVVGRLEPDCQLADLLLQWEQFVLHFEQARRLRLHLLYQPVSFLAQHPVAVGDGVVSSLRRISSCLATVTMPVSVFSRAAASSACASSHFFWNTISSDWTRTFSERSRSYRATAMSFSLRRNLITSSSCSTDCFSSSVSERFSMEHSVLAPPLIESSAVAVDDWFSDTVFKSLLVLRQFGAKQLLPVGPPFFARLEPFNGTIASLNQLVELRTKPRHLLFQLSQLLDIARMLDHFAGIFGLCLVHLLQETVALFAHLPQLAILLGQLLQRILQLQLRLMELRLVARILQFCLHCLRDGYLFLHALAGRFSLALEGAGLFPESILFLLQTAAQGRAFARRCIKAGLQASSILRSFSVIIAALLTSLCEGPTTAALLFASGTSSTPSIIVGSANEFVPFIVIWLCCTADPACISDVRTYKEYTSVSDMPDLIMRLVAAAVGASCSIACSKFSSLAASSSSFATFNSACKSLICFCFSSSASMWSCSSCFCFVSNSPQVLVASSSIWRSSTMYDSSSFTCCNILEFMHGRIQVLRQPRDLVVPHRQLSVHTLLLVLERVFFALNFFELGQCLTLRNVGSFEFRLQRQYVHLQPFDLDRLSLDHAKQRVPLADGFIALLTETGGIDVIMGEPLLGFDELLLHIFQLNAELFYTLLGEVELGRFILHL